jgi:CubicO group peptidase (beta-lactamase class C family)
MTTMTDRPAPAPTKAPSWWERQGDVIMRRPFNEWTFTHMNWLLPSERIARGVPRPLPAEPADLGPLNLADLHRRTHTTAFVVLRDGRLAHESYPGAFARPGARMQLWSVSKSVLSMMVGIALAEGVLGSIDDTVAAYRPDFRGTAYEDVTLEQLLDMTSGVGDLEVWDVPDSGIKRFERAVSGGDITEVVKDAPRSAPAGERFNYSTFDSQVLGWVLEAASGQSLADYASRKLWRPVGAEHDAFYWLTRRRPRTAIGAGSLNATARDLARLGQMMLDDGMVGSERVVPAEWVRRSRVARHAVGTLGPSGYPHYGYANHWWILDNGAYTGVGVHGQYLYIDPAARVVIVKCSAWPTQDDPERDATTITALRQVAAHLSAGRLITT